MSALRAGEPDSGSASPAPRNSIRDIRDSRNARDPRDPRDSRDPRDVRDLRELLESRDTRDHLETRDIIDTHDILDVRDQRLPFTLSSAASDSASDLSLAIMESELSEMKGES